LFYLVSLLLLAPGCQALHRYRPVAVLARDAETKQPIAGAEVRITYPFTAPTCAPWDSSGTTKADGVAHLRAAPYGENGIMLDVTAKGYMFEDKGIPIEAVVAIPPAGIFEAVARRPVNFVMELYAEPRPTIELIVPVGFRGLVKVDVQIKDDAPLVAGQRCFSYIVPASGAVQATGPSLLRRVFPQDYHAKVADGTPLTRQAKDAEIGFWWLKSESGCQYFVLGTRNEFDDLRSAYEKTGEGHSSGGSGGGRSHRHRGASQSPSS